MPRRTRKRDHRAALEDFRAPVAFIGRRDDTVPMDDNPNKGKRHTGRLPGAASDDLRVISLGGERIAMPRPCDYAPLRVITPARDSLGRRAPRSAPTEYIV
jgi:hypothetical protein